MTPARARQDIERTVADLEADFAALAALGKRIKGHADDVAQLADAVQVLGEETDETTGQIAIAVRRHKIAAEGLGEARFNLGLSVKHAHILRDMIRH